VSAAAPSSADLQVLEARITRLEEKSAFAEDLAERLVPLTQLTSLNLRGNKIGAAGALSLAALNQLTFLNLRGNEIGDVGAAALAALTQLTSLNLRGNEIGDVGAAGLAALTQLTSLNLGGDGLDESKSIGDEGAASLAALTKLTFLEPGAQRDRCCRSSFLGCPDTAHFPKPWGRWRLRLQRDR
jgi:Leucine-rich repeat (LRR) protein